MKLIVWIAVICASLFAMSSGARYIGTNAGEAERILDASQGVPPVGSSYPGHPRGHAKGVDSGRPSINSLQDFSKYESYYMIQKLDSKQGINKTISSTEH